MLSKRSRFRAAVAAFLMAFCVPAALAQSRVSALGRYEGFSRAAFNSVVRSSEYVAVRDGTRIAVDVLLPAVNGRAGAGPFPVAFTFERYHRARFASDGRVLSQAEMSFTAWTLLQHGYAVAAADVRGGGASYGSRVGELSDDDARDAADIIEWLAARPWCTGRVGMYGGSYDGVTQLLAASERPPHLAAIVPAVAAFDTYDFLLPGGVLRETFVKTWAGLVHDLDTSLTPVPVDGDDGPNLARAAQLEHRANLDFLVAAANLPYRDGSDPSNPRVSWATNNLSQRIAGMNAGGVPVYLLGGWFDAFARDTALWWANLTVPRRLLWLPFPHSLLPTSGWPLTVGPMVRDDFSVDAALTLLAVEHLRFFDRYLKGVDNGIDREPPVAAYLMGAPAGRAWQFTDAWPPATSLPERYYLQMPRSGSVNSVNDGQLGLTRPQVPREPDAYRVDPSTTTGSRTRWSSATGGAFYYGDTRDEARKSLTYTTAPLERDLAITGHPIAHLWVSGSSDDADVFAYLEEVDETGRTWYVSEGNLRASNRALGSAPWVNAGLPWHPGDRSSRAALTPLEPVELVFDLQPTSNVFEAGHRVRLRVTGADAGNYATPRAAPAPELRVFRDAARASFVELPVSRDAP